MEPLVDSRDVHFPTEVPFVESVPTNGILDLLMVAFISGYCAMAIIEVDMLSQYHRFNIYDNIQTCMAHVS